MRAEGVSDTVRTGKGPGTGIKSCLYGNDQKRDEYYLYSNLDF